MRSAKLRVSNFQLVNDLSTLLSLSAEAESIQTGRPCQSLISMFSKYFFNDLGTLLSLSADWETK